METATGLRGVLAVREFRALTLAWVVSLGGDQLARVALSVLVFDRTRSAVLTATVYAVTFLPAVVGGPLLSGLADRLPRRSVLLGTDLGRGILVLIMAIPDTPLGILLVLLFGVSALEAPFSAARGPLMRVILADRDYRAAVGLDVTLRQLAAVFGFAGGGFLLTVVSPSVALLVDVATFAVSGLVVLLGVHSRAAALVEPTPVPRRRLLSLAGSDARSGLETVFSHPLRRRAVLLTWVVLAGTIAPEGLAAPWAAQFGGTAPATGLILAAPTVGQVLALLVVTRAGAQAPERLLFPLALLATIPLLLCAINPSLPVALALLGVSGAGISMVALAQVVFVEATPDFERGRAFGVAAAGVTTAQGIGIAVAGALAETASPPTVVALLALVCLIGVVCVARTD